jgi:dihydrodipicolinate synthase/N-acetylneuraminate lyase
MKGMLLEGIFLPLTTPFHADGRLFVSKLAANVARYSRTPAAGFLVLSECGEADGLTGEETLTVLRTVGESAAREKVLIASVGRESVFATLQLAAAAAECGYDAVAVRPASLTAEPSMEVEAMTYLRAVADGAALPLVLLDHPARTLPAGAIEELAGHPNVIGMVDAAGAAGQVSRSRSLTAAIHRQVTVTTVFAAATRRMLQPTSSGSLGGVAVLEAQPALKTRTRRVGFQILTGSTATMLQAWQAGAIGSVPRLAACAPQACCEVWQAFRDGDLPLAEEKQERVRQAASAVEGAAGVGALKYGCDFNAYYGGRPRLPLLAPTAAHMAQVEHLLAGMRV